MKVPTALASLTILAALNNPAVAVDRNVDTPFLCDLGTKVRFDLSDADYLITRVSTATGDVYYFDPAQNAVQMIDAKYHTMFVDRNFSPVTELTINNLPIAQSQHGEILEGERNDNAQLRCLHTRNKRFVMARRIEENPNVTPSLIGDAIRQCGGYARAVGTLRVKHATHYHQMYQCF